ncbi:hypothetical protein FNV43_RR15462 [Rhamnella rubrinervis]|uniref:Ubiquitin-like protease family profile domain-containing protein n=1 Tax=Rhamnella rubrinervis TaxID=2594499 RepID=A0A8K0E6K9_9ROSA|nr:hypothetical protein FNV43_RR15462 [Rhamnella rubrinervis]
MENTKNSESSGSPIKVNENDQELQNNIEKLITALPQENSHPFRQYKYNGTWFPSFSIRGVISSQLLFEADESDIFLASFPKCGTTWLMALIFSIVNRGRYKPKDSPLLSIPPQGLAPNIEINHFRDGLPQNLEQLSRPRIFTTHMPYASLPKSIKASNCRIVYVCRNPLDTVVSYWHFINSMVKNNSAFAQPKRIDDEFFDNYCRGIQAYGPFWDNILEYWQVSLEKPESVLFMTYEDLKEDSIFQLKRLASFLGFQFSAEEEAEGEVGDYVNHLTPSMIETLNRLVEEKFAGSGLVFKSKLITKFCVRLRLNGFRIEYGETRKIVVKFLSEATVSWLSKSPKLRNMFRAPVFESDLQSRLHMKIIVSIISGLADGMDLLRGLIWGFETIPAIVTLAPRGKYHGVMSKDARWSCPSTSNTPKSRGISSSGLGSIYLIDERRVASIASLDDHNSISCFSIHGRYVKYLKKSPNEEEDELTKDADWEKEMRDSPFDMYALGMLPIGSKSWLEIDYVYVPVNNDSKHWLAAKVDIRSRHITLYDSDIAMTGDKFQCNNAKCLSVLFPYFLMDGVEDLSCSQYSLIFTFNIGEEGLAGWPVLHAILQGLPHSIFI